MRPPLKPLDTETLRRMVADADVIATGTVTSVTRSKTLIPPLETITIKVTVKPERVFKGKVADTIGIQESYKQFPSHTPEKGITAETAGPMPQVGRYKEGARILVFLKTVEGSKRYLPLGSGNYDAYLGVLHITPEGVKSDKYGFDEALTKRAGTESGFLNLIISLRGDQK